MPVASALMPVASALMPLASASQVEHVCEDYVLASLVITVRSVRTDAPSVCTDARSVRSDACSIRTDALSVRITDGARVRGLRVSLLGHHCP
eukprot:1185423-Prorocentrum_minimum.AAC.2